VPGVKGRSGGANRKSSAEHQLTGTFRRDRHATNLAILPATAVTDPPPAPRGLSPGSRNTWAAMMAQYEAWTPSDLRILQLALEACDRAAECRRRIAKDGLVRAGKRHAVHPLARVERQSAALAINAFKQLALRRDDDPV
jgi:hypothetical protein